MIIHINSYAGVGKLTIATALAELIGARLLDNHTIYNVAFALTEFRSNEFYDTVRAVRDIAYRRVLDLPVAVPVILTNWSSRDSDWGNENWDEIIALARKRGSRLNIVVLTCSPEENARRIQSDERVAKRKPRDPDLIAASQWERIARPRRRPLAPPGRDEPVRRSRRQGNCAVDRAGSSLTVTPGQSSIAPGCDSM